MHHRVRTHHWVEGQLSWKDIWFDTLDNAKEFIRDVICDTWKIFDCDDIVVDCGDGKHEHHHHHDHDHHHDHHHHGHHHHHHHHHGHHPYGYCY